MLFLLPSCSLFFFFNDTATTEIYTLSLHDALPISVRHRSASSFTAYPACELGPFTATGAPPGHSTMRPPITSTNPPNHTHQTSGLIVNRNTACSVPLTSPANTT